MTQEEASSRIHSAPPTIRILFVSDIHERLENLHHIDKSLLEKADYVLCLGDILNLKREDQHNEHTMRSAHDTIHALKLHFKHKPFYYIPGNHDTLEDFSATRSTEHNSSAHGELLQVNPHLCMAFFGGAPPGYRSDTLEQHWDGFPFDSQKEFTEAFEPLQTKLEQCLSENPHKQCILLTHCGPTESQTTLFWKSMHDTVVLSGSTALEKLLKTNLMQQRCIANFHGHTHPAEGRAHIARVPVINVGAIREGRYAYAEIRYDSIDGRYKLASLVQNEFHVEDPQGLLLKKKKKNA